MGDWMHFTFLYPEGQYWAIHLPRNSDVATKKKPLAPQAEEKALIGQFEEEAAPKEVAYVFSDPYNIAKRVKSSKFTPFQNFQLNIEAVKLKQTGKIDSLIAVDAIRTKLVPYNFQLQTALQVINEMNGNAILADEVGLGKTIEAGLIMKELLLRGEVDSVLVVSPKSLLSQWKSEMWEKFSESFEVASSHRTSILKKGNRVICSHNLLARKYDLLARQGMGPCSGG